MIIHTKVSRCRGRIVALQRLFSFTLALGEIMDSFKISHLYLDKYRTIHGIEVSFDHRFVVQNNGNWNINYEKEDMLAGPYFYGDKIYSMSCIVGRNGEGKTSLVDFIHESFLLMMKDIGKGNLRISADSHKVELSDDDRTFYHIGMNTEFLIVFSANGNDYYFTNIDSVKADEGIEPYSNEVAKDICFDQSCVAYFSMMKYRAEVAKTELQMGRIQDERAIEKRGLKKENAKGNYYRSISELFGNYKVDLSEEKFNNKRSIEKNDNLDILMQLVFMKCQKEMVNECLGEDFSSRMMINSYSFVDDLFNNKLVKDFLKDDKEALKKSLLAYQDGLSYLRPFSSGQYSRFALLARLYWFLKGSHDIMNTSLYGVFSPSNEYRRIEEHLFNHQLDSINDSILLFDEGDLCYHPEWQRKYVNDIRNAVKKFARGDVQIIFTTNSPFMMSDMLREDIVTLAQDTSGFGDNSLTFGQNIHTLLAHRFFLNNTIGEVSENVIDWLIGLLTEPTEELREQYKSKEQSEADNNFVAKKMVWLNSKIKEKGLSENEIAGKEEEYVNRSVYEFFKAYCDLRKWQELSDKSKFIENLISNIGEEVYRKQLYFRYESYKGRIAKYRKNTGKDKAEELIKLMKQYKVGDDDQALQLLKQKLQEMADQGEI